MWVRSECHADFEADAPSVGVGVALVGEAADVVNLDEFEDVVDADAPLDVGFVGVHADGVLLVGAVTFFCCDMVCLFVLEKDGDTFVNVLG